MASTRTFGLSKYGGVTGGSAADDDYKFSNTDRDLIDALFSHFANHDHLGTAPYPDPSAAPTLGLVSSGGSFAPDLSLHYVVTYVDRDGLETARSAEAIISTSAAVGDPAPPVLTGSTGGALVVGNYNYWLTQVVGGIESAPSSAALITLQAGQNRVHIVVPVPLGTTPVYNIYRQGPADIYGYKIHQIDTGSATTYNDDGAVSPSDVNYDPTQILPTSSGLLTGHESITITVPVADNVGADPQVLSGWRVYRALDSSFTSPALVATVVQTVNLDGTGGLVVTFTDTGADTLDGTPPLVTQSLGDKALTDLIQFHAGAPGGGTAAYPPFYVDTTPTPHELYVYNGSAWAQIGGGGSASLVDGLSRFSLASARGVFDPGIHLASDDSSVSQDTLAGATTYYVLFKNTAGYVITAGQDWQITASEAAEIHQSDLLFWAASPTSQLKVTQSLTLYGLAKGDTVYVTQWGMSFTQADASAVLHCSYDTMVINDNAGALIQVDPRLDFIIDTAATTVGVDHQLLADMQIGTPDTTATNRLPAVPGGLAADTSVSGQVTLSWTEGGSVATLDFSIWGAFPTVVATASPGVVTGLAPGLTDFHIQARSAYGLSNDAVISATVT